MDVSSFADSEDETEDSRAVVIGNGGSGKDDRWKTDHRISGKKTGYLLPSPTADCWTGDSCRSNRMCFLIRAQTLTSCLFVVRRARVFAWGVNQKVFEPLKKRHSFEREWGLCGMYISLLLSLGPKWKWGGVGAVFKMR